MAEKKQTNSSVQEVLKELLSKDVNLLNSRDDLINQLGSKISGGATRELNPIRKALQNNVGEILLTANIDGSEEAKEEAKSKIEKILQEQNLQEKAIKKTIDTFVYALDWNKPKEQPPVEIVEPATETDDDEILGEVVTPPSAFTENANDVHTKPVEKPDTWICSCGTENDQNFCSSCGQPKPSANDKHDNEWICPDCGTTNTEKFCSNCGHAHDEQKTSTETVSNETQYIPPVTPPEPEPQPKVEPQQPSYTQPTPEPQPEPSYTQPNYDNNYTQTPPPAKKSTSKYIMGGIIGVLVVLVVVFGVKAMRNNDTTSAPVISSSTSDTTSSSSSDTKKAPTAQSDLSLGGVDLGDSIDDFHNILGLEDNTKQKGNYMFYNYSSIQVGVKDGVVDALVSQDSSVETKRGIHQGSSAQDVFAKYGTDYMKSTYEGLTLYEYKFNSIDGRYGLLRFAINGNSQVQYISVRIPDDGSSSNNNTSAQEAQQALNVYYSAISTHNMNTAYSLLSDDMQKHMGTIDAYAKGYQDTLSDVISNVKVTSNSGDEVAFSYTLTSRDKYNGGDVKVQTFDCTALLSKKTGHWHITNLSAKKTGEHIETR